MTEQEIIALIQRAISSIITVGYVEDVIPGYNAYRVTDPVSRQPLFVTKADTTGFLPTGAQPVTTLPIGSQVLLFKSPDLAGQNVILGGFPFKMTDKNFSVGRSLVPRVDAGVIHDDGYRALLDMDEEGSYISNFNCSTPWDAIPGDWGYLNDSGLGVLIGRFLSRLVASNFAKIEAFTHDDLVRQTAWNFEHYGAALERRIVDDGGEYNDIWGMTPYIWEGMGVSKPDIEPFEDNTGEDSALKKGQTKARYEPKHEDQQGLFRHRVFKGYLGDGEHEYIGVHKSVINSQEYFERYGNKSDYVGLLEVIKHIDGRYAVRSAKEITFEKICTIPVPKEMYQPEDSRGDKKDNYKAAQQFGDGDDYDKDEFDPQDDTSFQAAHAQLFNYHSYLFNHYFSASITSHKKDWDVPEESKVLENGQMDRSSVQLERGSHKFLYDLPPVAELRIDHRNGHRVKYYQTRSVIKQLDDGSILIEDGYGTQYKLGGGSTFITAPNDVFVQPGRNFVVLSPHDAIIRAGNSADVTAAKGDVRLKAERNLHALGGNSGNGGILLESRGEGQPTEAGFSEDGESVSMNGIILKAKEATVDIWAKNRLYFGLLEDSGIVGIDAKEGQLAMFGGDVISHGSKSVMSAIAEGENVVAVSTRSTVSKQGILSGGNTAIVAVGGTNARLIVDDDIAATGAIAAIEDIVCEGYLVSGSNTAIFTTDVDIDLSSIKDAAESVKNQASQSLDSVASVLQSLEDRLRQQQDAPGSSGLQNAVGFSLRRTVEDYRLDDSFVMFEARWQQLYRLQGGGLTWDEPVVESPNSAETRPYPGQDAWTDDTYAEVAETNYNVGTGKSKDRDSLTKDGGAVTKKSMENGYLITVQ